MRKSNSTSQLVDSELVPYAKEQDYVTKLRFYIPGRSNNIYTSFNMRNAISNRKGKNLPMLELSLMQLQKANPKLVTLISPSRKRKNLKLKNFPQKTYHLYEKRVENEKFESAREAKHSSLQTSISNMKSQINFHYKSLTSLSKSIDDTKIEIGILNQYSKLSHTKSENDECFQNQLNKIKLTIQTKQKHLQNALNDYENLKQQIKKEESHLQILKQQDNSIKNELIVHYHNLLLEGKDTRNEGLSWIIKRIWKFNEEIIMSFLPKFLDLKAINYLFEISKHALEKDCEESNLQEMYKKVFIRHKNKNDTQTKNAYEINNVFIKGLLSKMDKQLDRIANNSKISFDKMDCIIKKCSTSVMDDDVEEYIQLIENKKKQIRLIQNMIEHKRNEEVNRINKEYLYYDYERKFNVPIVQVLSALVGEDHLDIEMNKVQREMRLFTRKLQGLRSFSFFKGNKNIN